MHYETAWFQFRTPGFRQPEKPHVLVQVRKIFLPLAFVLNSQEVNNVGRLNDVVDMTGYRDTHLLEGTWNESARAY
jgi:hypothetical protein